jgi:hypothetical protein
MCGKSVNVWRHPVNLSGIALPSVENAVSFTVLYRLIRRDPLMIIKIPIHEDGKDSKKILRIVPG